MVSALGARPLARVIRRWIAPILAIAALAAGCASEIPLPPESSEPLLHLLLRPVDQMDTAQADSGVFGTLLTMGTVEAAHYRAAEKFEMVRMRDGQHFAWRAVDVDGVVPRSHLGLRTDNGNYFLPRSGDAELGWEDVRAGDEYSLRIETEGATIVGRVLVPGEIASVEATPLTDSTTRLVWTAASRSGGYLVGEWLGSTVRISPGQEVLHETSTLLTPRTFFLGVADTAVVLALDSALTAFIRDPAAPRSGIEGGFGIFGAYTRAIVPLPETPAASATP